MISPTSSDAATARIGLKKYESYASGSFEFDPGRCSRTKDLSLSIPRMKFLHRVKP